MNIDLQKVYLGRLKQLFFMEKDICSEEYFCKSISSQWHHDKS